MAENGTATDKRGDFWRNTTVALVTCMATILTGWFAVGSRLMGPEDVKRIVVMYLAEHDDYGKERESIKERLARAQLLETNLGTMTEKLTTANVKLDGVLTRLDKLEARSR